VFSLLGAMIAEFRSGAAWWNNSTVLVGATRHNVRMDVAAAPLPNT